MQNKKKFVIIDGNAIVHRAYHALPPMTTKDGTIVNAVFGFTSMLLKVMKDLKPDYLAVSFDVAGESIRKKVYDQYKATRVKAEQALYDQIPLAYKIVEVFDIPIYTKEGYEADDVIGTIANKLRKEDLETIIVTGDMDMLQLVDDKTKVYELRKGLSDIVLFDAEKVKEKYGFGPEMVVEYKSLRGDTSDNIPGIKGIGEKTATELIQKIGGIEDIYKDLKSKNSKLLEQFKPGVIEKIKNGKESAEMSHDLATIRQDVKGLDFDLKKCAMEKPDENKIKDLFHKFEFFSLLKRLPWAEQTKETSKIKVINKTSKKLTVIEEKDFEDFLEKIIKHKQFGCMEVLAGNSVLDDEFLGMVFVLPEGNYYLDWKKITKEQKEKIRKVFEKEDCLLVGHDLKQLVKALKLQNIEVKNKLFDVMIASYLINSSTRAHDLKSLVMRELNQELSADGDQGSLFGVDPKIIADKVVFVLDLYNKFKKELEDRSDLGLFEKIEMKLIPVLAEIELNGVAIDKKMLEDLSVKVKTSIKDITKNIYKEAGQEFNVSSSVQLREVLFDKMGLPAEGIKKGKTGYSTAASELEKLHGVHPIIEMIEEYRELEKLRNTYIDVLPGLINKKTGRIHTSFNQAVTTTGRLSSSDPNLQNIPIRTEIGREIRRAFIAEPGNELIAADYSQIELRIVASLAQDEKMIQIFKDHKDIHKATAAAINGVPLEEVTKEMRYAAKEVNFGVLYGMGAYGLSWRTKIPQWQAKEFINKYFTQFAGVKKYMDQTLKFAKQEGYVETLFGRRRYIPELKSDNFQLRSTGERMAINMPIQGTAADLMKMAMIAVYEKVHKLKYKDDVKITLQVHDELVLEVKKGLEDEVIKIVKETMETVTELRVPIDVDVHAGKRWGDLK